MIPWCSLSVCCACQMWDLDTWTRRYSTVFHLNKLALPWASKCRQTMTTLSKKFTNIKTTTIIYEFNFHFIYTLRVYNWMDFDVCPSTSVTLKRQLFTLFIRGSSGGLSKHNRSARKARPCPCFTWALSVDPLTNNPESPQAAINVQVISWVWWALRCLLDSRWWIQCSIRMPNSASKLWNGNWHSFGRLAYHSFVEQVHVPINSASK